MCSTSIFRLRRGLGRDVVLLALLAVLPAAAVGLWHPRAPSFRDEPLRDGEVTLAMARDWGASVLWIDARSAEAYAAGHVPGAVLLNEEDWDALFPSLLAVWRPDRPAVVYCSSLECGSSRRVAERLREDTGTSEIFFLRGGWEAWSAAQP